MNLRVVLVATLVLAGCLSNSGPPEPDSPLPQVADLTAEGADVQRLGRDLALTWAGDLGRGAEVPLVNGAVLSQYDRDAWQIPVDFSVATVTLSLDATDVAVARLRDGDGNLVCVVRAGRTCANLVDANISAAWPLEIISLAPEGSSYTLTATLGADDPVLGDDRIPFSGYSVFRSEAEGGEPTLAVISDASVDVLVVAGTRVLRLDADDGLFTDVTPPLEDALSQTLDPFLYGDDRTGRIYLTQLAQCSRVSWTDDGGDSWTPMPPACGGPEQHHQKVTVAHPMDLPVLHMATMNLASWLLTEEVVVIHSRSLDGGITWTQNPSMVPQIHGLEARAIGNIAAANTDVYAIAYLCDRFIDAEYEGLGFGKSTDLGATWTWTSIAPGGGRCEGIDPGIWARGGGQLDAAWEDMSAGAGHVWHAASRDAGESWDEPSALPTFGLGSFAFTDVVSGGARIAIAFLATPDTTLGPTQAPGWARWYPYVLTRDLDRGGWRIAQLQQDPVQIGPICMDGPKCLDGARNLLDFIDLRFAGRKVVVAYPDGCEGACDRSWESRDAFLRVAVEQESP